MEHSATLIAVLHILIALILVIVVLVQDSKGGNVGGAFGGGSSQSIFGASGAASFLVKLTRYLAVGFMATCILLTILSARTGSKSVIDSMPMKKAANSVPQTTTIPVTTTPAAAPVPIKSPAK